MNLKELVSVCDIFWLVIPCVVHVSTITFDDKYNCHFGEIFMKLSF